MAFVEMDFVGGGKSNIKLKLLTSYTTATMNITNNTNKEIYVLLTSYSSEAGNSYNRTSIKSHSGCDIEEVSYRGNTSSAYSSTHFVRLYNCGSDVSLTSGSDAYGTSAKDLFILDE